MKKKIKSIKYKKQRGGAAAAAEVDAALAAQELYRPRPRPNNNTQPAPQTGRQAEKALREKQQQANINRQEAKSTDLYKNLSAQSQAINIRQQAKSTDLYKNLSAQSQAINNRQEAKSKPLSVVNNSEVQKIRQALTGKPKRVPLPRLANNVVNPLIMPQINTPLGAISETTELLKQQIGLTRKQIGLTEETNKLAKIKQDEDDSHRELLANIEYWRVFWDRIRGFRPSIPGLILAFITFMVILIITALIVGINKFNKAIYSTTKKVLKFFGASAKKPSEIPGLFTMMWKSISK